MTRLKKLKKPKAKKFAVRLVPVGSIEDTMNALAAEGRLVSDPIPLDRKSVLIIGALPDRHPMPKVDVKQIMKSVAATIGDMKPGSKLSARTLELGRRFGAVAPDGGGAKAWSDAIEQQRASIVRGFSVEEMRTAHDEMLADLEVHKRMGCNDPDCPMEKSINLITTTLKRVIAESVQ